jgi:hypothetical protein
MAVAYWFLRCMPGISTLLLLIVVEYSLQLGRSTYHYVFHAQYQLEYTPPLIWQLLFAVYSIFLHLVGVLFPIRLARAARRATRSIWTAHMNLRARGSREEKAAETENAYHVMQVVIIPCFKESIETIRDTLNVLASHQHAKASYDVRHIGPERILLTLLDLPGDGGARFECRIGCQSAHFRVFSRLRVNSRHPSSGGHTW